MKPLVHPTARRVSAQPQRIADAGGDLRFVSFKILGFPTFGEHAKERAN